jgi:hypothetical protein
LGNVPRVQQTDRSTRSADQHRSAANSLPLNIQRPTHHHRVITATHTHTHLASYPTRYWPRRVRFGSRGISISTGPPSRHMHMYPSDAGRPTGNTVSRSVESPHYPKPCNFHTTSVEKNRLVHWDPALKPCYNTRRRRERLGALLVGPTWRRTT